jgi:hypothetical protein
MPSRTVGRAAVAATMTMVVGAYGRIEFRDRRFLTTGDGGAVVGRWRTDIEVLTTGRHVRRRGDRRGRSARRLCHEFQ